MSTDLITLVTDAWGWTGIAPAQIVGDNPFGNLMIEDHGGCYWRLCPEDLYCTVIARSRAELNVACRPFRRGRRQARLFIGHLPACFVRGAARR